MESLDRGLRTHVSRPLRSTAVEQLWGPQPSGNALLEGKANVEAFFDSYFRYYSQQCDLIGRHAKGRYSSVETHSDIMEIARLLQQPLSRDEVWNRMSGFLKAANKEQHENSINLVARLLLMVKFGNILHECGGGRHIEWSYGSLAEFVHDYFSRPPACGHERVKLEKSFNALNLQRIAGIKIRWTDNLADHLRMMDDDKAVAVFHHASFLEYQLYNPMFPAHFIEETLRTIALFFPKYDSATRKWYHKVASASSRGLDIQLVGIENLSAEKRQIENFWFWHDRLVILKEVYDEAQPSTLSQWSHDRRNGVQCVWKEQYKYTKYSTHEIFSFGAVRCDWCCDGGGGGAVGDVHKEQTATSEGRS